jgi:hypothetical protein
MGWQGTACMAYTSRFVLERLEEEKKTKAAAACDDGAAQAGRQRHTAFCKTDMHGRRAYRLVWLERRSMLGLWNG